MTSEMTNKECAAQIRQWVATGPHPPFSWVTDGCGYEQHLRFVKHRNAYWSGRTQAEFKQFVLDYADSLEQE